MSGLLVEPLPNAGGGATGRLPAMAAPIVALRSQILQELEGDVSRLLSLNPSRREAIAHYLDRLSGSSGPATQSATSTDGLRRWIEGTRTAAQNIALQIFFEEVALITLGQAILLKAWDDRGVRRWCEADIGHLNWALGTALKAQLPLDREGWQITRPNLYSWYNPGPALQKDIWKYLSSWRVGDESPGFLAALISGPAARQAVSEATYREPQGYDPRFFEALWEVMPALGFQALPAASGGMRRSRVAFSPTLRDGGLVRGGPNPLTWIGLEASVFHLLVAELSQLWWGPSAPPLWGVGTGLEVHSRDQLALALTSAKPSLLSRISEMEACDLAFVLEEQTIRGQTRSPEAHRFREQADVLPYFKKLRKPGTTLGDLQACVALSKLRPGGLLWWAREEALSGEDGCEMLSFVLERAKLVCEWDFSELQHSLPASAPLFPKHLYLLSREPRLEDRIAHRPLRVSGHGQIRSYVELPQLLADALALALPGADPAAPPKPHTGQWTLQAGRSPTAQKEWTDHWPDPACQSVLRRLERARKTSLPLAHATTISHTPKGDPARENSWTVSDSLRGLWVEAGYEQGKRRLLPHRLPSPEEAAHGSGYLVLVPDESWIAPLRLYLESDLVQSWLEQNAERRGERWVLSEQVVKWIPVPKALLRALGLSIPDEAGNTPTGRKPLPGHWEQMVSEIGIHPTRAREVHDAITALPEADSRSGFDAEEIRSEVFVRAARALHEIQAGQDRLHSVVDSTGRIRWRGILDILPRSEFTAVTFHSRVKISGNLPPHIPIGRLERVRMPSPGILLSTELGFSLHLASDQPVVLDMLWEQLEGIAHPTWSELLRYLRLPRRIELAEITASDVLRSHGERSLRIRELSELLSACTRF